MNDVIARKINKNATWLTVVEACKYLKCGKTKLYQLVSSGELKSYRLDKSKRSSIRLLKYDINRYMLYHKKIRLTENEKNILNEIGIN